MAKPRLTKFTKKRTRRGVLITESAEDRYAGHRDALSVKGHVLYPSARTLLKRYVRQARRTGMIRDAHEEQLGIKALLSAAMAEADKSNSKVVTPKHVYLGWYGRLSVGGGNHPPHRCYRSSVINRVDELKESLPYFDEFLSKK